MIKVLFDLVQEYYWPSFEPIYKVMADDSNFDLWLKIGPNQKRFLGVFLISQKKEIENKFIKQGYQITNRCNDFDAVICGSPLKFPEKYGQSLLCNVDHGPGFKTLRYREFLKQRKTKYIVFLEGQYRVEKFKKYGLDKIEDIYKVGLPKLDPFFTGVYNRKSLIKKYKLNPDKKTVLYAPSYKPTSIFLIGENITSLLTNYNVIIKLHPYSWSGKYASHSQHKFFEKLVKKYPELHLVRKNEHNIMPYLFISDTMISDGSSVINEFLALNRCGVIFDLDDEKLKHSDGQPLLEDETSEWLKNSFIHISNSHNLLDAVNEALNPSEKRKKQLLLDKQYIFSHTDGKSSLRVKQIIAKLVQNK
ncbi:MAG: CDP-glycerol glycerophosphotransferase family protein [Candidatus Cloacimonetes bacterium]|nr:CDP-glycerol glycerophosphotransferase family protein [Candidatus Cloacimonadota bacterium]MBL7085660.1 CDP-glycerol glycerophosphotransferase family protein [Candidatus Cloacimonadota bacterium]